MVIVWVIEAHLAALILLYECVRKLGESLAQIAPKLLLQAA
jgi:hypothetical protein